MQAQRNRVGVPPFKPLPPGASRPMAQQPERQRLIVQQNSTATAASNFPRPVYPAQQQDDVLKQQQQAQLESKLMQQQKLQQEMLAMQMLKQQRQQQQEAMLKQQQQQQMVQYPQQALQQATQTRRTQVFYRRDY